MSNTTQFGKRIHYSLNLELLYSVKSSGEDTRNYQAQVSHEKLLLEDRNQKCDEYEQALAVFTNFREKASKWTEYSNRIHKSEEEQELIDQVFNHIFIH